MNNHPHKTSWTDERVAELLRLNATGMTASRMAMELGGVSRDAVICKLYRLGLSVGGANLSLSEKSRNYTAAAVAATRRRAELKVKPAPRNPVGNRRTTPPKPPVERDEPPGACTLTTLVEHSCRWPIGSGEAMTYCGEKRAGAHSYCDRHYAKSVQPFTGRSGSAFAPDLARALRRFIHAG